MRQSPLILLLLFSLALLTAPAVADQCCNVPPIGETPINDLGQGLYLGLYEGGLYAGGSNNPPQAHFLEGRQRSQDIAAQGGPYVLLSIGMCNTSQEFCSSNGLDPCDPWTFMGQAAADSRVNTTDLVIANGAHSGQSADKWVSETLPAYAWIENNVLIPKGLGETDVRVAWVKVANAGPTVSLPDPGADAFTLVQQMGDIARALRVRYPNLEIAFFSSRIYAGYANTALNPEPYAYESGFAVKWLIQAQIDQIAGGGVDPVAGDLDYATGAAPWIAWGPYLWADGTNARSDGLTWECCEFAGDGTHPGQRAERKVGRALLNHFLNSPFARHWFRVP